MSLSIDILLPMCYHVHSEIMMHEEATGVIVRHLIGSDGSIVRVRVRRVYRLRGRGRTLPHSARKALTPLRIHALLDSAEIIAASEALPAPRNLLDRFSRFCMVQIVGYAQNQADAQEYRRQTGNVQIPIILIPIIFVIVTTPLLGIFTALFFGLVLLGFVALLGHNHE